jgi:hypothetical protein
MRQQTYFAATPMLMETKRRQQQQKQASWKALRQSPMPLQKREAEIRAAKMHYEKEDRKKTEH